MARIAAIVLIGVGAVAFHAYEVQANGANSRNSQCDYFNRKAAFAKSVADRARFRKLHQQCLRTGG